MTVDSDYTVYLEAGAYDPARGEAALTLRTLKARDIERPAPLYLLRRRVPLNEADRRGQPMTSCLIERDRRTRQDREAEHDQAVAVAHRDTDLRVLRCLRDHPDATSLRVIRHYVALGDPAVRAAVGRILQGGWAEPPGRQRQPYTVTAAGHAALNEGL